MKKLILKNKKTHDAYLHYLYNKHFYVHAMKFCGQATHLIAHTFHLI